jgi:ferrous iron transport protein B
MASPVLLPSTSPPPALQRIERIALVGNPNTGKTTLFNKLCGANAKTSNFPGTTTALRIGRATLGAGTAEARTLEVIDLPGLYGLTSSGPEARIVTDVLQGAPATRGIRTSDAMTLSRVRPDAVVVLVDATNLARNLVLVGELLARSETVIVALNMIDLATRRGLRIDAAALSARIGAPVIPMVASRAQGLNDLRAILGRGITRREHALPHPAFEGTGFSRHDSVPAAARLHGADSNIEALTNWADEVASGVSGGGAEVPSAADARTERLDRILTHPVLGMLVFLAVMGGLFWSLFALAAIPMALIEATFAQLGGLASRLLPDGPIRELISEGIIGGIAGTAVFLPQICLLFFLISLLEDTGYLARAAFVNDRFFRRFGLPGQAFVPLLTSHACALPGIMSARLIPDRRDRLATILVAPFMSCSARLPVYVLLTSLLFADRPAFAGLAFAACYLLGATAAFASALAFGKTVLRGRPRPMVLELPTYKMPSVTNALLTAKDQGLSFLKTAGTVIMAICVVMWWLSAYPKSGPTREATALRAQAQVAAAGSANAQALIDRADALDSRARETGSFAGRLGRTIEPVFKPLGYDWQLTVGILTSFLAREVFVSTMSVLAGDSGEKGVVAHIRTMTRGDGSLVFTRATAASALVFFVLAMQCLATLTVTRRETGALKYAALQFAYMSGLAYVAAFVVYQGLRLAGVS